MPYVVELALVVSAQLSPVSHFTALQTLGIESAEAVVLAIYHKLSLVK